MKSSRDFLKYAAIAFVSALVFYFLAFHLIEGRRKNRGPWEVVFLTDHSGNPSVLLSHPRLKITNQALYFGGEKLGRRNMVKALHFDSPTLTNLPFGRLIYHDLTFLPGALTFDFFGHEVELLPRTLVVDKKEIAWRSQPEIRLGKIRGVARNSR